MLRVWLPLTKDLRQQGLSNITVTNNGATYNNTGGKLGGCYSFDGVDDAITIGNLSTLVTDTFSFSCWFYHNENWSSKNWETIFGGPSGFELESKNGSTNSPIIYAYSWGKGSFAYELSKWNHLVMTRTTSETKFYLNGELKLTGTAGSIPSGNYFIGSWSSTTGQNFRGKINDVRIYDHCLSPMEVKELAKGLVLHYPLNRQGFGQENLLLNSNDLTLWPIEGNGKIELQEDGYFKVSSKASNTTRYGIYYNFTFPEPNTYTFSVDVKDDWLIGVAPASTFTWTVANLSGTQGKKRISYTCTSTEENNKCRIYIAGNGTGGRVTYLKQPKFEKGSVATPWCPNSSDALATTMGLNSTTEYDCSGFCNNGTRTGTFSWTSDTPKYAVDTEFAGDKTIYIQMPTITLDWSKVSFAAWGKWNAFNNWSRIFDIGNASGGADWDICLANHSTNANPGLGGRTGGGASWPDTRVTEVTLTAGQWYHFVETIDGTTCKLYVNGELKKTITLTNSPTITTMNRNYLGLSNWSGNGAFKGGISDFRIYATALSADDVKSLYQNSAYIDSSGNVYGAVHSEV